MWDELAYCDGCCGCDPFHQTVRDIKDLNSRVEKMGWLKILQGRDGPLYYCPDCRIDKENDG